jgi:hypothetical protein
VSNWLLAGVALVYLWVAVDYFLADREGLALAFGAYAVANVGFIVENVLNGV